MLVKIQMTLSFSNSQLFLIVYQNLVRRPSLCWLERLPVCHSIVGTRMRHLLKNGCRGWEEHEGRVLGWAMECRENMVHLQKRGNLHLGWAERYVHRTWQAAPPVPLRDCLGSSEDQKQRKGLKYWWSWPRPLAEEPKDAKDRQRMF